MLCGQCIKNKSWLLKIDVPIEIIVKPMQRQLANCGPGGILTAGTGFQFSDGKRMGKAAAPCSGSGGILSVLSAVPCLSCKLQPHKSRRMSDPLKSTGAALATAVPGYDTYKGWLFKWTNYLKGYQRRWFVLSNGLLSYYRTKAEMAHTCRGTINLATAHIDTEDSCNIVLTSGGRTYHLKASSEVERQRWVTGLELAKAKAIRMMHDQSDPSSQSDKSKLHSTLKILSSKLDDLNTCNDLISKHGAALQRSLSELENLRIPSESGEKIKAVNERATLFRITSNAMINACRDFLELAETTSRKWQRALQYEQEQRIRLEETIEQLAKQHNSLEQACREAPVLSSNLVTISSIAKGENLSITSRLMETSDEDEETEYFDAMEDTPVFDGTQAKENNTYGKEVVQKKKRRTRIPDKPNYSLNLWSIMKNCIGKELSKIPMPVNFNEPLSMLQRLTEDLEYHELLDKAAKCESSLEQICYIAAFSVSSYSTTVHRTAKPFNPLLGETYELDRFEEYGYRSICEQVSHHPPAAAHHVYSRRGWTLWQEITIASKFRGKYLSIMPLGAIHLQFHSSGNHYVWRKVTSTVHNIIVGKLWIDQSGDIDLVNLKTKETCQLKFTPYSYFSRDIPRKVTGVVTDCDNKAQYILSGTWDEKMECAKIMQSSCGNSTSEGKQKTVYQTLPPKLLWKKYPLLENAENMYYFSELALTLNEFEEGVAPTDSRLRPDQHLMENGLWDEANVEKQRLEEKQRSVRRRREAESAESLHGVYENYQPLWFEKKVDSATGEMTYMYKGGYWEAKEKQDWKICPDIF
uniref:Oxysterol-binding protein n=1 Tax=Erpetoichthys calabaricus TaxID=27687 RepID=A0A8C4RHF2_ERPCA